MLDASAAGSKRKLTLQNLDQLLEWLAPDRERAGQRYEEIRRGLIRVFLYRGCAIPEELADETIDRVAGKLSEVGGNYVGEPGPYFFGVANNIYLEYLRRASSRPASLPANLAEEKRSREDTEPQHACLEECIQRLPQYSRELILAYYGHEKGGKDKIEERKKLALHNGIAGNRLRQKTHRIRVSLKKCLGQCLQGKQQNSFEVAP